MIAAVRTQLARLSLRSKLVGLYLLFGILPVMLLAGAFYQLSLNILLEKATENLQAITAKNNELVESQLKRIDEAALMLTVDQELHSLMYPALPPATWRFSMAAARSKESWTATLWASAGSSPATCIRIVI